MQHPLPFQTTDNMAFTLDANDLTGLTAYLRERKWIAPDESISSAEKPGEGNMNYVLRVRTNFRSFIIKQARNYVEKYPSIPAPAERADIEGKFYELIQQNPILRSFTPEMNNLDLDHHVLTMEDLGSSSDFLFLYKEGKTLDIEALRQLIQFLSVLHQEFTNETVTASMENRAMRQLNAEHIFNYPYLEDNEFNLDEVLPGLQDLALTYKTDQALKSRIKALGDRYLTDGKHLLHGDYYPGSWLKTLAGDVKVIDPEFCFLGPAEFDLSVTMAHLIMADQPESIRMEAMAVYKQPEKFDMKLMNQLTGVEIMRRIIGLAQLPLSADLEGRKEMLKTAYALIMGQG